MITERRKKMLCLLCVLIFMGNALLTLDACTYGERNSGAGSGDISSRFSPVPSTYTVNASGDPSYSEGSLSSGSYTDTYIQDGQYQVSQSSTHIVNQQNIAENCNGAQDSSQVGSIPWSNPSNAQGANDGLYTTATCLQSFGSTHYLVCQNFGFNIPTGYSIIGIVVQIYRHADLDRHVSGYDYVYDQSIRLVIDSSPVGVDKRDTSHWGMSDAWASYGSPSDGWGAGLQTSDVNASGFGVAIAASFYDNLGDGNTAYVDAVSMTVYYAVLSYQIDFNYNFQFAIANHTWIQSITLSTTGKTSAASANLFMWNYVNYTWDSINLVYTSSESPLTRIVSGTWYLNSSNCMKLRFERNSETVPFSVSVDSMYFLFVYCVQCRLQFTPHVTTGAELDIVPVQYTANGTTFTGNIVVNSSTLDVWVDQYSRLILPSVPVTDYAWYEVNYPTPINITSNTSLDLQYVKRTNHVTTLNLEGNKFTAGGTLELTIALTTTYTNMPAKNVNLTIWILSENRALTSRNGITWINVREDLQNNGALIIVPLPEGIGNGTLEITTTVYGSVEPRTDHATLSSSPTRTIPDFTSILLIGGGLTSIAVVAIVAGVAKRRSGRKPPSQTLPERQPRALTGTQPLSIIGSIARMKFDMHRGVELEVIRDKDDSKFLHSLKEDATRCATYFDSVKSSRGTLTIFEKGEHIVFVPFRYTISGGGRRYLKDILVISTSKELQKHEIKEIRNRLIKSEDDKTIDQLLSTLRN